MKKVFLALAMIASVACFTSCNKSCTCTMYIAGNVAYTNDDVDPGDNKCKDLNTIATIAGTQNGLECKSNLF